MNRAETINFLSCLSIDKPALLRGETGIGKSALLKELAAKLNYNILVEHPAEREPTDYVGLPYLVDVNNSYEKQTRFAQPFFWPDSRTLLVLEEIDRISDQMQPIIMQLIMERTAGGRKLPLSTIIVATCNGESYLTQPLDQALVRRFAVIDYKPTVDEWIVWAKEENLDNQILDYIQSNPSALDTPEKLIGKRNQQIPCRANWTHASYWLKKAKEQTIDLAPTNLIKYLSAFVGYNAAVDFASWQAGEAGKLDIEAILTGKLNPKKVSLLQASHSAGQVAKRFLKADALEQMAALEFYLDVGDEAFANFFAELPREAIPRIKLNKRANEAIEGWLKRAK